MKKFSELCVFSRDKIVTDLCTRMPILGEMYPNKLDALSRIYLTPETDCATVQVAVSHIVYLSEVLPFCMSLISKNPDAAHELYSKFQSLVELAKTSLGENVADVVEEGALLAIIDGLLNDEQVSGLDTYPHLEVFDELLVETAVDFIKTNLHTIRECYEIIESHEAKF